MPTLVRVRLQSGESRFEYQVMTRLTGHSVRRTLVLWRASLAHGKEGHVGDGSFGHRVG